MRIRAALAVALLLVSPRLAASQHARAVERLQALLAAEDRRASGAGDVDRLQAAARDRRAALLERVVAVRALGRLERAEQLPLLDTLLDDRSSAVRREAANGMGQAAQGLTEGARLLALAQRLSAYGKLHLADERGVAARTIGRLPYPDSAAGQAAQSLLLAAAGWPAPALLPTDALHGALHGLYDLARQRRRSGDLSPGALALARGALHAANGAAQRPLAQEARRLAALAITANGSATAADVHDALQDARDPQLRRLGVAMAAAATDSGEWRRVAGVALADASFLVRLEGVRLWRQRLTGGSCEVIERAMHDAHRHVRLAAIDALGACRDRSAAVRALEPALLSQGPAWHERAHALVALARIAPGRTRLLLTDAARDPVPQVRLYAARAALIVRDSAVLSRLAFDSVGNVREAALDGLAATSGHVADGLFIRALASPYYQVVLAAARALKGAPSAMARDSTVPALVASLQRLTAEGRDNSRDPRLEVLARIGELGSPSDAGQLQPYLSDADPEIARRAAGVLATWLGRPVTASPMPHPLVPDNLGATAATRALSLEVTMTSPTGSGGTFVIALRPAQATATVARLVRLAQDGYFNGLTFHRVEPNFVIQGGSPAATEYVGDGPFLRDELDLAAHTRGTVGISTRGRDTGDAQIFVNLVDNFRLDHNYTVVGTVVRGMDVVDGIVEGDVMARVVVRMR